MASTSSALARTPTPTGPPSWTTKEKARDAPGGSTTSGPRPSPRETIGVANSSAVPVSSGWVAARSNTSERPEGRTASTVVAAVCTVASAGMPGRVTTVTSGVAERN